MTLRSFADFESGRDNNLNLIRMIAASAVLISHSYPISLGPGATEPLELSLGKSLGHVAVLIFFAISGYLIAKSYDTRRNWRAFLSARASRLFPALIFVLVLTVIFGGLFLTTAPALEYLKGSIWYLIRNLTLAKLQYELPGVFLGNPYGPAINGSLWTLFYEVLCYFAILVLGIAGLLSNRFVALSLILSNLALLAAVQTVDFHPRIEAMTSLAAPFSVGAAIYVWRDQVPYSALVATVLWIFALGLLKTDLFAVSLTLALAYTALFVGFHPFGKLLWYNRLGDYSYGTYVFAFPIQQLVASFGIVSPIMNMLLAFPLVLAMAIFSWHFVEAPALKAVRARSIDPRTSP